MKKVLLSMFIVLALSLSFVGAAKAGTATSSLNVYADIIPMVQVGTHSVHFHGYAGTNIRATGNVHVNCVAGIPFHITLDAGHHYDGASRRLMHHWSTNYLSYYLFKDPGGIEKWGDSGYLNTYPHGSGVSGVGSGAWEYFPVHGLLIGNPIAPSGFYSDAVGVTVYF